MKKLIFLIPIFLMSCAEYKARMAEETQNFINRKVYFSDDNREFVSVSINGISHELFFDTGAGITLLYRPKFTVDQKKKIREKSVYGFDKKTKIESFNYSADSMQTSMFKVTHKYLYVSPYRRNLCDGSVKTDGILGSFYESDAMLELNYSEGYLQFTERLPEGDWMPLEAKFSDYTGKVYIRLNVNGTEDFFLFDTGNKTMTMLNRKVFSGFEKGEYTISSLTNTIGNTPVKIEMQINNARFNLPGLSFDFPIGVDQTSERSILNKALISKFDWVFDRRNGKVYCRARDAQALTGKSFSIAMKPRLLADVHNDGLIISYRNFDTEYQVGDEIVSVNGKAISQKNICEMKALLNDSSDWSGLHVITAPRR
ncbi:hypothetical protein FLLO111716_12945 [Flavobacterium longum]|uniref:hypothetical protein n=1 Tax=Flavobacterium longum TaxID=1299340 RepID=UPI0039EAFD85